MIIIFPFVLCDLGGTNDFKIVLLIHFLLYNQHWGLVLHLFKHRLETLVYLTVWIRIPYLSSFNTSKPKMLLSRLLFKHWSRFSSLLIRRKQFNNWFASNNFCYLKAMKQHTTLRQYKSYHNMEHLYFLLYFLILAFHLIFLRLS